MKPLSPTREAKFRSVIARRQPNITVVLENVHDPHNLGAVMRSCDAIGIMKIHVCVTEKVRPSKTWLGKKSSAGSRKWVDVETYNDIEACFKAVRAESQMIYGTYLHDENLDKPHHQLYDLDLTGSVALVFGNELRGLSEAAANLCDAHFLVPQMGMAESLNVSVACAVSLYEAMRQRLAIGAYEKPFFSAEEQNAMYADYVKRGVERKGDMKLDFR